MITCQQERIADIRHEVEPILVAHYDEIAHYKDIPLDPDWDWYCASPILRCFTVRIDGALVGYDVYGIGRNKHYRSSVQAVQDIIFVLPQHRGLAGVRLLRFGRAALKAEGVQVAYRHQKRGHAMLGAVLERMGSELVDYIWAERLDRE